MRVFARCISFVAVLLLCHGVGAQNIVDTIQSNIDQAMKPAQEIFSQAMEPAKSLLDNALNPAQDAVQSFAQNVGNNIASVADQAGSFVEGLATNVVSNVNEDQNVIISNQLSAYHSSAAGFGPATHSVSVAICAFVIASFLLGAVA